MRMGTDHCTSITRVVATVRALSLKAFVKKKVFFICNYFYLLKYIWSYFYTLLASLGLFIFIEPKLTFGVSKPPYFNVTFLNLQCLC